MVEKRPHPGDDVQNDTKRTRSNNGSPAPATNGAAAGKPDIQAQIAAARARAAELAARLGVNKSASSTVAAPAPSAAEAARAKIEAMKARVAAATAKSSVTTVPPQTASSVPVFPQPDFDDGFSRARGGLGIGLHPALMGDSGTDARSRNRQAMQPKFATTMANRRAESPLPRGKDKKQLDLSGPSMEELKKNPYFDPSLPNTMTGRTRHSRQLNFHQKGKFIAQANALRRQAQLEQMKRRIAESARKAGLDDEGEKAFLVPAPPDIEWWDEGLIDGKDYNDLDRPGKIKLEGPDSIITAYIQHPVALEPPQDKTMPPPKPMYLTKREQAKTRRQRRNADHKEQQAKIRLGLEPPPPPKVKKSNLMRVLGQEAVKDPTAVEARVNREIAERQAAHLASNEARKLTKEQKVEKVAANQEADAAKGIYCTVYKIDNLSYGQHRYKIDINAKQLGLTGIVILHPKMNLVIVEGGEHGISKYKKLLLNRIDWTENALPSSVREGNREAEAAFLKAEDEQGRLKDLSLNKCVLVWEGVKPAKAFRKWGSRVCETDGEAREVLQRSKMDSFWTLAKSMQ